MWRSRRFGVAVILGAAIATGGVAPGAVHASSQVPITFTINAHDTLVDFTGSINTGTGTASHLGLFTETGTATITSVSFPSPTELDVSDVETYVFTAANGDTIDLVNTGTGIEDLLTSVVQVTGSWQITGGTGRFSGATGQGTTSGTEVVNNSAGTADGTFTLVGTLSTVGSLR